MFKTLEDEILKLNASKIDQAHIQQVRMDVNGMMGDLNQELRRDFDDKINHIAVRVTQDCEKMEGIVTMLDNKVMLW